MKNASDNLAIGREAELKVEKYLRDRQFEIAFTRLKTSVGEIDLIALKEDQILLIEVKSLNNDWRAFQRVKKSQHIRLRANELLFRLKFNNLKVKYFIAWVKSDSSIEFCAI